MKYDIRYSHELVLQRDLKGQFSEELRPGQQDWCSFRRALAGAYGALARYLLLDKRTELTGAFVRVVRKGRKVRTVYEKHVELRRDR